MKPQRRISSDLYNCKDIFVETKVQDKLNQMNSSRNKISTYISIKIKNLEIYKW